MVFSSGACVMQEKKQKAPKEAKRPLVVNAFEAELKDVRKQQIDSYNKIREYINEMLKGIPENVSCTCLGGTIWHCLVS